MNTISIFAFEEKQMRAVLIDGEPWFVGKDVAGILGYADEKQAIRMHCKRAVSLKDTGVLEQHPQQDQQLTELDPQTKLIPESDVYRLIIKSRLPAAEAFEKKLMEVILPEIRRTGGYNLAAQTEYVLPKNYVEALKFLVIAEEEKQALLEENAVLKPKAEFHDVVVASELEHDMKQAAKILFDKYEFKIGRNKLFEVLRDKRILMDNNEPYQQYVTRGLFRLVITNRSYESGYNTIIRQVVVTNQGIDFIYKLLIKNNIQQQEQEESEEENICILTQE